MKRWFKRILFTTIFIPIFSILIWYCIFFLPYLSKLKSISKQGSLIIINTSDILYPIIVAGESKVGIRSWAMRSAYISLVFSKHHNNMGKWHLNNILWYISSYIHFTDKEIFYMWAYYAPYEGGRGLANAATYYFSKPLSDLNEREYAALVAAVRSPLRYKPGTELSEKRINEIFKRLKNS